LSGLDPAVQELIREKEKEDGSPLDVPLSHPKAKEALAKAMIPFQDRAASKAGATSTPTDLDTRYRPTEVNLDTGPPQPEAPLLQMPEQVIRGKGAPAQAPSQRGAPATPATAQAQRMEFFGPAHAAAPPTPSPAAATATATTPTAANEAIHEDWSVGEPYGKEKTLAGQTVDVEKGDVTAEAGLKPNVVLRDQNGHEIPVQRRVVAKFPEEAAKLAAEIRDINNARDDIDHFATLLREPGDATKNYQQIRGLLINLKSKTTQAQTEGGGSSSGGRGLGLLQKMEEAVDPYGLFAAGEGVKGHLEGAALRRTWEATGRIGIPGLGTLADYESNMIKTVKDFRSKVSQAHADIINQRTVTVVKIPNDKWRIVVAGKVAPDITSPRAATTTPVKTPASFR
jgi:hypothetical protein